MARPPRIQFEGALYHVTTRGNRRELIVKDAMDYAMLQKTLIAAMNYTGIWLYAWCLMPNHLHALVETPEANLSDFIQRWLTAYARYFNARHSLVGHVFQGRYNAKLCQKESYFKELIRYIHLNPYRVKTPDFAGPMGWKWSSHRYYMGTPAPEGCQRAIDEALLHFGSDPPQARKNYAQFLADGLRGENWERFYKEAEVLGDKGFEERSHRQARQPIRANQVVSWALSDLLKTAQEEFQMSHEDLAGPSQKRDLGRVRQAVVYVARLQGRISVMDLAKAFQRDPSAISQMIRRKEAGLRQSEEVSRLVRALEGTA